MINEFEAFAIWFGGFALTMIVVVARYYITASKKHMGEYLAEGTAHYAIFWPVTIPAHLFAYLILKAGKGIAKQVIDRDIVTLLPNKGMTKDE